MSDHLKVDTSSVRNAGAGFDAASLDAINVINDAMHRLNKYEGVWGKDETGEQFEKVYAPPRDGLLAGLEVIPQLLQNYAGGLGSTAAVYDRANDYADDLASDLTRSAGRK